MHEVLVNRLGGLSLPRKSLVRLTDRPDMTLDVYRGRKTTQQQQQIGMDRLGNSYMIYMDFLLPVNEYKVFFSFYASRSTVVVRE